MKSNTNIISFIIALLVIAVGVYWYFFTGTGNQPPLSTSMPNDQVQTKFQSLFSELLSISFNTDIFSDPRFNALVDLTTPVDAEPSGRLDPFAGITATSITNNTVTASTSITKVKGNE